MSETLTQTKVSISELENAVRESQRKERALAREVDELPDLIRAATHADAIRKADAARQGKDSLAEADEESEVPQLREREKDLPFLRWSQSIRTAALEAEYNGALQAESEDKVETLRPDILPAKEEADAATARFNRIRSEYTQSQRGVDVYSGYKAQAEKRLAALEREYPGV